MFALQNPAWEIVLRTTLVYLAVLIGLRLAGKREIGQLTVFDLAVLLLISNSVQNAMVGPDSSLPGGLIAAVVLLVLNAGVAQLRLHVPSLRPLIEGSPTVLVMRGQMITEHMRREGVDQETLKEAMREHGLPSLHQVEMAVLEMDGTISIVQASGRIHRLHVPARSRAT